MFSLALVCPQPVKDIVVADLWERGTLGITEKEMPGGLAELRAFFEDTADAASMLAEFSPYAPELEPETEVDWQSQMEQSWPVLEIGRTLFVAPVWSEEPTPEGRVRLTVHPGMAFGTGTHESTRLVMEALENYLQSGAQVLDLGCGSGILAEAAKILGAGRVAACDIDPDAVAIAREHSTGGIDFFTGSARAVRGHSVDFVAANINAENIVNMAGELQRMLRPGGQVVASGFLHADVARVRAALGSKGFSEVTQLAEGDWVAIVAKRA